MDTEFGALYMKYDMRAPDPTPFARPLPSSGPPFPARAPSAPPAPQLGVAAIDPEEEVSDDDDDDDDDDDAVMAQKDAEVAAGVADSSSDDEEDDDDEDDDEE